MSEYRTQVLRVRNLLSMTSADMREAIAQISLLPDTAANVEVYRIANRIEGDIRELEARAVAANQAAFKQPSASV